MIDFNSRGSPKVDRNQRQIFCRRATLFFWNLNLEAPGSVWPTKMRLSCNPRGIWIIFFNFFQSIIIFFKHCPLRGILGRRHVEYFIRFINFLLVIVAFFRRWMSRRSRRNPITVCLCLILLKSLGKILSDWISSKWGGGRG